MVEHGHELLLQHIVIIVLLYYCLSLLWLIYKEPEVRMCRKKTVCTGFSYIRGFRSPRGGLGRYPPWASGCPGLKYTSSDF